jgi:hypothetical protein
MQRPVQWYSVVAVCLLSLPVFSTPKTVAQGVKNGGPTSVLADQEQIVSYWTSQGEWHSELQLRNNLPAEILTVTPFVRGADGNETPLPSVVIAPQEVRSLDLRSLIDDYAPQLSGSFGCVALSCGG